MKKARTTIIASALVGCMLIGGISAYFTDGDTATNTFTVGKVEIDLQEPTWTPPTDITPEQEFKKDPKVVNTGINDAYVFMEVTVPRYGAGGEVTLISVADEEGNVETTMGYDLFEYTIDDENWVELTRANIDGFSYPISNRYDDEGNLLDLKNNSMTRLYAYAKDGVMTPVKAGEETSALFPAVKFKNITEDQYEGASLDIVINAYAIQTTNINDGDTSIDGDSEADGKDTPADVWSVIANQNPSTVKANEGANTDIVE